MEITIPQYSQETLDQTPQGQLAEIANTYSAISTEHARGSVEAAVLAGRALRAIKATCKHGEWGGWLTMAYDHSVRHAERMMAAARRINDLGGVLPEDIDTLTKLLTLKPGKGEAIDERKKAPEAAKSKSKKTRRKEPTPAPGDPEPNGKPEKVLAEVLSRGDAAVANRGPIQDILNQINATMRVIRTADCSVLGWEVIDHHRASILSDLQAAKNAVTVSVPYAPCPKCKGEGCATTCGNTGWLNRHATKELERNAK